MNYNKLIKEYRNSCYPLDMSIRNDLKFYKKVQDERAWGGWITFHKNDRGIDLFLSEIDIKDYKRGDPEYDPESDLVVFNDFINYTNELKSSCSDLKINMTRFSSYLIQNGRSLSSIIKYLPDNLNNQDDYGWTILMEAASWENIELVEYLINKNVDMSLKSDKGLTVLDIHNSSDDSKLLAILTAYDQKTRLSLLCDDDDSLSMSL